MHKFEEIEQTLFELFNKNINYLKLNYYPIYDQIVKFEKLNIETQYIDFKDGSFDIIDITTNKLIYNCNSFFDAEYRANHIESSNAIFSIISNIIHEKDFNNEEEISAHKFVKEILDVGISKKLNTSKFIFIGTILGIHINNIHKKVKQLAYLILEPSIETFRLSLFFTDYEKIAETSNLFFSIQENQLEIKKTVLEFLEYKKDFNNYIKFELASEKEFYLINLLKKIFISVNPFITPFSENILSFERGFKNIKNTNGLFNITNLNLFNNIPILIVGAGPSLEKYQDFIKNQQKNFFIVATGASLKRLEYLDVIPDVITNIDKKEEILEQFNISEKYYKNSIIFLGPKTNHKIIEKISSENIFIVQENHEILKNSKIIDCVSVGDFSTKLCLELGANSIYILGIDAAFDKSRTHDSTHSSYGKISEDSYQNEIITVKGNFREFVKTNLLYSEIISSFQRIILKENINIYNLSDGAKLENCIPLELKKINSLEMKKLNKQKIRKTILKSLKLNSFQNLLKIDNNEFTILEDIQKDFSDSNINLLKNNNPNSKVINIFDKYLTLINPYLNNNKELMEIKKFQMEKIYEKLLTIFKN